MMSPNRRGPTNLLISNTVFLSFLEPIPAAAVDAARPPGIRAQQQRQRPS